MGPGALGAQRSLACPWPTLTFDDPQPARPDQGPPAGDGGQGDDLVAEEDRAHGGLPRSVRRDFRNVDAPDELLGVSVLGIRREQEDFECWCVPLFSIFSLSLSLFVLFLI